MEEDSSKKRSPNKCFIIKIMMPWFHSTQEEKSLFFVSRKFFQFIWILFIYVAHKYIKNHFSFFRRFFYRHFGIHIFTAEREIFEELRLVISDDMSNTVANERVANILSSVIIQCNQFNDILNRFWNVTMCWHAMIARTKAFWDLTLNWIQFMYTNHRIRLRLIAIFFNCYKYQRSLSVTKI